MSEYYVVKVDRCPACKAGKIHKTIKDVCIRANVVFDGIFEICGHCNGTGRLEFRVALHEALEEIGKSINL